MTRTATAGYGLALLVGVAWIGSTFPSWTLLGELPPGRPGNTDLIQHVIGQRYFWHQPWHFHRPLVSRNLDVPYGVMIGLTDSLPLVSLLLKPFIGWLPPTFQAVTPWLALCWLLQPVAAVFALRSAGEKGIVPAAVAAACASAMPTFLMRASHAALCSHFVLLAALGIALRLSAPAGSASPVAAGRVAARWLLAGCLLIPLLLLVHPYLMMMAVIVLFAAPATALIRRDRRWMPMSAGLVLSVSFTALLARGLGYLGGSGSEGFGLYSMNLLSPIWPETSALLRGEAPLPVDATGGQYEGFQYLGAGLLLGLATLLLFPRSRASLRSILVRQPGLLLSCLVLTLIALSDRIYLGHRLLLSLPQPPDADIFRSSGRFFWPVAYAILVGTIAALAKVSWRPMSLLLIGIALLQTTDAAKLHRADMSRFRPEGSFPFDADRLQGAMENSGMLTIFPAWPCASTVSVVASMMDVLSIADRVLIPVDTMYTARMMHSPRCAREELLLTPLRPDELRVILPSQVGQMALVPHHESMCRPLGSLGVCGIGIDALLTPRRKPRTAAAAAGDVVPPLPRRRSGSA